MFLSIHALSCALFQEAKSDVFENSRMIAFSTFSFLGAYSIKRTDLHCNWFQLSQAVTLQLHETSTSGTVIIYLVPSPHSLLTIAGPHNSYMYVQNLGLNLSLDRATTKSPIVVTYLLSTELAMLLVLCWLWFCQMSSCLVPCWLAFVLYSGVGNLVSLLSTTCLGPYLDSRFNTFIH